MATKRKTCQAGHKGCDCGMLCCALKPARVEEIRAGARSGTNWAAEINYGPACVCGMKPSRRCYRHERGDGQAG